MLDCLDKKAPAISECEGKMHTLWKLRRDELTARDAEHVADLIALATAPAPRRLDEFGRDTLVAARARLLARCQRTAASAAVKDHDWLPSDDEGPDADTTEAVQHRHLCDDVVQNSKRIFADVLLDFSDYRRIADRFQEWKATHRGSYGDSFAGESLRKILQPSIRLEVLDWNPLENGIPDFEQADWAAHLVEYGVLNGKDDPDDQDNNLVPHLVDEVVVPKLAGIMEFVWNPLSYRQSKRAKEHVTTMLEYPIQDNMKLLFAAIVSRLKQVVAARLAFPAAPQIGPITPEQEAAAVELLEGDLQVLHTTVYWADLLNLDTIQELCMQVVCDRMLTAPLMQRPACPEPIEWHERIAATLPSSWFSPQSRAGAAKTAVRPIIESLGSLGRQAAAAEAQRITTIKRHYHTL
jgi:hypothetical protein